MSNAITLPGSIPGLLGRGSPVRWGESSASWVYVGVVDGLHYAAACDVRNHEGWFSPDDLGQLALDLTDATGRAHAAWWALPLHRARVVSTPGGWLDFHNDLNVLNAAARGADVDAEHLCCICLGLAKESK